MDDIIKRIIVFIKEVRLRLDSMNKFKGYQRMSVEWLSNQIRK